MLLWHKKKKLNGNGKKLPESFGKDVQKDLEFLLQQCRENLKRFNEQNIIKAFHWCVNAHKDRVRKSGMPYYTHPLAVAHIVVSELPMDDVSVISALLHDVVNHGDMYTIKDIKSEFGPTVAEIVDGVSKIKTVENHNIEQLENYRKLLLSLFKDIRIILIKLADRIHNMRTLDHLDEDRQKKIALETLEIYAPFASRFGLGNLKWELEDLAFKYADPDKFREIKKSLNLTRSEREEYIENFIMPLESALLDAELIRENNIKVDIFGRPKHIYSIFNKMRLRQKSIDELYDLFAVRIIIDSEESSYCFLAYSILANIYKPVPGTFKNYISEPKKNGYQSLHVAVLGPDDRPVEVQIRTRRMHEISERGFAAHFKYKRGLLPAQSVLDEQNVSEWMGQVRDIFENSNDISPDRIYEIVRKKPLLGEIYVFTPANEFRIMPANSTPLDFAYDIHTEVGNHCIGAKVNGKVVPLDTKLQTGDQVEILTSQNQKPSKDWLKYVITPRSKSNIEKSLKDEYKRLSDVGKEIWTDFIKQSNIKISEDDFTKLMEHLKLTRQTDFFHGLGTGSLEISFAYDYFRDNLNDGNMQVHSVPKNFKINNQSIPANINLQSLFNNKPPEFEFPECCCPLPGDIVIGEISGSQVIVHRSECNEIKDLINHKHPSVFALEWDKISPRKSYRTQIRISGEETASLLGDISSLVLSLQDAVMKGFRVDNSKTGFVGYVTLKVHSKQQTEAIISKINTIRGITHTERYLR